LHIPTTTENANTYSDKEDCVISPGYMDCREHP
jgi:hypothetical protein